MGQSLKAVASHLSDNMLAVLAGEPLYGQLERECFPAAVPPPTPPQAAMPPAVRVRPNLAPIPDRTVRERRPTVRERVRNPHILSELMRVASHLSAQAQMDFLEVLQTIAEAVREALVKADAIREIEVNHGDFWRQVRGRRIAFVDGGVANLESIGSAPIAIRVGAYTVTPGERTDTREEFTFERVLISELYAPAGAGTGFYREEGDDPAQLRDAARFCLEVAGAWNLTTKSPPPDWLMVHGPLVNPVAMYRDLPPFSADGLEHLLPAAERAGRKDRDAHFIPVYRRQLELLRAARTNVCGVVERASGSRIAAIEWLKLLTDGGWVSSDFRREAEEKLYGFRISDPILFQVVLEPGEYLRPIAVDRNDVGRAPNEWVDVIRDYPKPLVSYVNVSDVALPLRVECFDTMPADRHEALFGLVVHSARLLPRYAFPAGLDIVDKHAKLPDWMAKPVNTRLATQMLQKAADRARESGNPRILIAMRQFLCGTTRDWLFRPKA